MQRQTEFLKKIYRMMFLNFSDKMGNSLARKRIKATDFDYLAKNTAFVTLDVSYVQYTENYLYCSHFWFWVSISQGFILHCLCEK